MGLSSIAFKAGDIEVIEMVSLNEFYWCNNYADYHGPFTSIEQALDNYNDVILDKYGFPLDKTEAVVIPITNVIHVDFINKKRVK